MANVIEAVVYTDDHSRDYVTGVDSEIFAQAGVSTNPKIGGAAAVAGSGNPPLPSSVKPRRVGLKSAAGKWRYVVCLEPTADLFTGVETTLSIEDSDGAATTYTRQKAFGEDFGRNRKS